MSNAPMTISFEPSGEVVAMHREDVLDLGFLGDRSIRRATDIRFDDANQRWGIWPAKGVNEFAPPPDGAAAFHSYEQARDTEIAWMEHCLLHDIAPLSAEGCAALKALCPPAIK